LKGTQNRVALLSFASPGGRHQWIHVNSIQSKPKRQGEDGRHLSTRWYRGWESNPHAPGGAQDFKVITPAFRNIFH